MIKKEFLLITSFFLIPFSERTQEKPSELTREAVDAIQKGLTWLVNKQNKDGSIGDKFKITKTAVSCLCFMADGSTPRRGPYAESIIKGLDYTIRHALKRKDGVITDPSGEGDWRNVHEHGYALLFLACVYGELRPGDPIGKELGDVIKKAIAASLKGQTTNGGWGYSLTQKPSSGVVDEGSCTVTQVQALRACRDAGFIVDEYAIKKAIKYLRDCHMGKGQFLYSLNPKQEKVIGDYPHFGMTSASIAVLNASGVYLGSSSTDKDLVKNGLEYMLTFKPMGKKLINAFYYYSHFYAAQAFYQAGSEYWKDYFPKIRDQLVSTQEKDGGWKKTFDNVSIINGWGLEDTFCGPEYLTACAVFVLSVPNGHLPFVIR